MNGKRTMLLCVASAMLAGCDYTVPLVKTPNAQIDSAIVGLWQRAKEDGTMERLLILPQGEQEYLVAFPASTEDAMFAKGCLWRNEATTLLQLDWFGTAQGKLPEDNRTFQFASYTVEGGSLTLRLLNPDVVTKDVESSEALASAIIDNKDTPKLYRDDMVFQKVKN